VAVKQNDKSRLMLGTIISNMIGSLALNKWVVTTAALNSMGSTGQAVFAAPNVTTHPSRARVPSSYYLLHGTAVCLPHQ